MNELGVGSTEASPTTDQSNSKVRSRGVQLSDGEDSDEMDMPLAKYKSVKVEKVCFLSSFVNYEFFYKLS